MSEIQLNKKAFEQATKELEEEKIKEVKGYIYETLKKLEEKKKAKELAEEEIRILKLDLEDLRNGKFEKIEERSRNSQIAKNVSVNPFPGYVVNTVNLTGTPSINWPNATSGTYNTGYKIYYF